MDLTSKQRAQLRGLANSIDTIVHVGKDGLGENLIKQADDALEAREIIKCKVLENSEYSARRRRRPLPGCAGPRWCRSSEQNSFCIVKAIIKRRRTKLYW